MESTLHLALVDGERDVENAVAAAKRAAPAWRAADPQLRAAALLAFADTVAERGEELARLDSLDNGSPLHEMRNDIGLARTHIGLLNRWNVRLSDVDTLNLAASLTLTVGLQVFAIVSSARAGMDYGSLLSVVLYVFEFSWAAAMIPDSWQQYVRLRDISSRLRAFA